MGVNDTINEVYSTMGVYDTSKWRYNTIGGVLWFNCGVYGTINGLYSNAGGVYGSLKGGYDTISGVLWLTCVNV